jgi:putative transposase
VRSEELQAREIEDSEAATKLIYLVLRNIARRWHKAPREWKEAMNRFAILYPDRFLVSG